MKILFRFIMFSSMAICFPPPCIAHDALPPIKKVKEIEVAFASCRERSRLLDLVGTIDALDPAGFVLADDSGAYSLSTSGCRIELTGGTKWWLGDLVRVRGTAFLVANGTQTICLASKIHILGTGTVRKPVEADASDVACGMHNYSTVRLSGVGMACEPDEIDPNWTWLLLRTTSATAKISMRNADFSEAVRKSYIDALITVTGTALPSRGKRKFSDSRVFAPSPDCIDIIRPTDSDPFSNAPPIRAFAYFRPRTAADLHRNLINGLVLASWDMKKFILQTAENEPLFVEMSSGMAPPSKGEMVQVVGFLSPNFSTLKMSEAIFRKAELPKIPMPEATDITAEQLVFDTNGNRRVKIGLNGRVIRLRGKVQSAPDGSCPSDRLHMLSGRLPISVYAGNTPPDRMPENGDVIEVTGICHMSFLSLSPHTDYSNLAGIEIIPGDAEGMVVIATRPWWTPTRFTLVATMLLMMLSGTLVWNRALQKLAERRGRELFRERIAHATAELKVEERTRLAVELHDSIAQSLTGVAFHITAADKAMKSCDPSSAQHIATATSILRHSRTDLRRCIWDLRNDALELKDFTEAVRKTILPVTDDAEVDIDIHIPRSRLSDSAAHMVLSAIRELTSNAVRHGKSTCVHICGEIADGRMVFSVSDNGTGFDATARRGGDSCHFGLDGIKERIRRLNGTVEFESSERGGALVTIAIPLPRTDGDAKK